MFSLLPWNISMMCGITNMWKKVGNMQEILLASSECLHV
uniref:Uncharacterized protein n=1 Tax=Anguilla anguilla TaxID=7936 RepID=A0A0E9RA60_ANGAN